MKFQEVEVEGIKKNEPALMFWRSEDAGLFFLLQK